MSASEDEQRVDLHELARRLQLEGMPPQAVVASEAGVSQATVSRAMRGQIKGVSRAARMLWRYTSERLPVLQAASVVSRRQAPDPALASEDRDAHDKGVNVDGEPRRRVAPLPRRSAAWPPPDGAGDRAALAELAIAGLRDYLADAFDPQLVIEQLAVLRRAQDGARRREIEPPPT